MNEKVLGAGIIVVMSLSLLGMIYTGISKDNLLYLILFSVSVAFALLFFEDWFEKKEE